MNQDSMGSAVGHSTRYINRDLPKSATKVTDELRDLVAELYERQKLFYRATYGLMIDDKSMLKDTRIIDSLDMVIADDGKPSQESLELFNGQLHPYVDNYPWYRGLCIPTTEGRIFLYVPWISIDESRHHEIYVQGEVKPEELDNVVRAYVDRQMHIMDEIEKALSNIKREGT